MFPDYQQFIFRSLAEVRAALLVQNNNGHKHALVCPNYHDLKVSIRTKNLESVKFVFPVELIRTRRETTITAAIKKNLLREFSHPSLV